MKITIICTLLLTVLACNIAVTFAYPMVIDSYEIVRDPRELKHIPSFDHRNRRSDDYDIDNDNNDNDVINGENDDDIDYVDNSIYPANESYDSNIEAIRRQSVDIDGNKSYRYTPILRYKSTRTERKKLFVPNLFG